MKIEELCEHKEQELLKKYFGDLVKEAAVERPETIEHYTKDLPLKFEVEYRIYLENLWPQYAPDDMDGQSLDLVRVSRIVEAFGNYGYKTLRLQSLI